MFGKFKPGIARSRDEAPEEQERKKRNTDQNSQTSTSHNMPQKTISDSERRQQKQRFTNQLNSNLYIYLEDNKQATMKELTEWIDLYEAICFRFASDNGDNSRDIYIPMLDIIFSEFNCSIQISHCKIIHELIKFISDKYGINKIDAFQILFSLCPNEIGKRKIIYALLNLMLFDQLVTDINSLISLYYACEKRDLLMNYLLKNPATFDKLIPDMFTLNRLMMTCQHDQMRIIDYILNDSITFSRLIPDFNTHFLLRQSCTGPDRLLIIGKLSKYTFSNPELVDRFIRNTNSFFCLLNLSKDIKDEANYINIVFATPTIINRLLNLLTPSFAHWIALNHVNYKLSEVIIRNLETLKEPDLIALGEILASYRVEIADAILNSSHASRFREFLSTKTPVVGSFAAFLKEHLNSIVFRLG